MIFSLFDLLLTIIFSQGLFLLVAVQLVPNKNNEANRVLTMMLSIASFMLLGRVLVYHIDSNIVIRFGAFIDTSIFLFGPVLYLYIRRIAFKEEQIYTLHKKHFVLAIIYFLYAVWNLLVDETVLREFRSSKAIFFVYLSTELIGILSMLFYLFKSYKLYQLFKKNQAFEVSFDQQLLKYLRSLILALTIFVGLWAVSFVSFYVFGRYLPFLNYDIMWISSALLMYFVGFYSLTQPHIFRVQLSHKEQTILVKDRLKQTEIDTLQRAIKNILERDKVYLESDLSLSRLAIRLNTTNNNLSWILNNVYQKNFYEFINEYRVQDFIRRIENNEHKQLTILSLALESGFNSKSTFNKVFKSIKNETPSNYIKRMENSIK